MKRLLALAVLASSLLFGGCAGRSPPAPPPAPGLADAKDALPADLDLVIRIDLGRVRRSLGPELVAELRRAQLSSANDALVTQALEHADVLLVAVRPRDATELDHVIVLEGLFESFDPTTVKADPPWEKPVDLGGAVRRWDRVSPPSRGAPARVYLALPRFLVFASTAEIDSTERALEQGERGAALAPPTRGVISFAARVPPLAEAISERTPMLASWIRSATKLEGSAELEAEGLAIELALEVDSPETAEHLKDALRALLDLVGVSRPLVAKVIEGAKLETAGSYVVGRCVLPRELLVQALRW